MFKQQSVAEFEKNGHKVVITCNQEMPLGLLHDILLEAKHWVVDRMIAVQKEEEEITEAYKKQEDCNGC
jgi:predicted glycosyltransferase